MRIPVKDLNARLKHNFLGTYFVFGDEPIQHKQAIDTIRATAKSHHFEREVFDMNTSTDWGTLLAAITTQSLFSPKRLIECRLEENKISKMEKILTALSQTPLPENTLLLISAKKIEAKTLKTNWFKTLEQKILMVEVFLLSREETLRWIKENLMSAGFQPNTQVLQLLFERTEGNLSATYQAIEKLKLCYNPPTLSTEDILSNTGIDVRFSVFTLLDALLSGSLSRTAQILSTLKREGIEPILVLWAITKEIRTTSLLFSKLQQGLSRQRAFTECGVWRRREPLMTQFMKRMHPIKLQKILIEAKYTDDIIKGRSPGDPWRTLSKICLNLAGGSV